MMASQKIICWNSGGLRATANSTPEKMTFFDKEFPDANFSIAAFVETHHKSLEDLSDDFLEYQNTHHLLHTPTNNETHAGIALLLSKNYELISQEEIIPGRLLNVKYATNKVQYNMSIFYGPKWKEMNKDTIRSLLNVFAKIHKIEDNNMIIGDFNFCENDLDKGKNMSSKDKVITPIWDDICSSIAVVDPFRMQYPRRRIYSFTAPAGKSRGDRIYISNDHSNSVANMKYTLTPFNLAHKIMTFNLQEGQQIGPGYWKLNSSILKDNAYKKEIEDTYNSINRQNIRNPVDWWNLFHCMVHAVTLEYTQNKAKVKSAVKKVIVGKIQLYESIESSKMTLKDKENYLHYRARYKEIVDQEIQGHVIRTRGQPRYEINEPNIDFFSKLEKRFQNKNVICQLQDTDGTMKSETDDLIRITHDYYKKLYTPTRTNQIKQQQLLRNVKKTISASDRRKLDAPLDPKEMENAVFQQFDGKSSGADGVTAEFYKEFWYLIKDNYLRYVNAAKNSSFGSHKNTSVTTIIYKRKGKIYELTNYRPISLINLDLKILAKALTNRLKPVLPSIIHESQTAVYGRRIDHTVHMVRDLIDLVNKEDLDGALIFLDQEKAFDRVDHELLFKAMEAFGIGDEFIKWVKALYSDASTRIKVNGFLTPRILLRRGVRQGCPLSPLLYVLVIELLALQLRQNPNIVGFQVGGEKIVSLHYADDAIIVIKQNQCFKEVIKDLKLFEDATGAKVNWEKTEGLWIGNWKDRLDTPMNITWTNKNVKALGVYFGNENPAKHTFDDIIPKVKRSMNYWKQFLLSVSARARTIEIFHASRLWYAATFYDIPQDTEAQLQKELFSHVNFPHKSPTVSQVEMQKLKEDGGLKLIDIRTKTDTYKARWLIELMTSPNVATHLQLMTRLIGEQKGGLRGTELFFTTPHYAKSTLKTSIRYYKRAIEVFTTLQIKKKIDDPKNEKLFYNPTFKDRNDKVLQISRTCENMRIYTYGQVLLEHEKKQGNQPHHRYIASIYEKITSKDLENRNDDHIYNAKLNEFVSLRLATHNFIYQQLIISKYKEHHSKLKWEEYFQIPDMNWKKIWESINNPVSTEDTKSVIWEQIHLNDYTTFSYNKWHNKQEVCPFCLQVPQTQFHITVKCDIVRKLWLDLEHHLKSIRNIPISEKEMAFGLFGTKPSIKLRNWMTFLLRRCIAIQENKAFYNKKGPQNIQEIKIIYNQTLKTEIWQKYNIFLKLERLDYFKKIFACKNYLIEEIGGKWQVLTIF